MIRISGLNKSFEDGLSRVNHLLRGVDLNVAEGDFVAITGASGSGKSTLLKILGTLQQPDSGSYLLNGQDMAQAGRDYSLIRNTNIGFLFQDHSLFPHFTAKDNILIPTLAYASKAKQEQIEYARELMRLTGVENVSEQYPATLSGGEAARIALCRALVMKPKLLLADEPTGQLDTVTSRQIVDMLLKIKDTLGMTIVMVTHSAEVAAAADRILELREGVIHQVYQK